MSYAKLINFGPAAAASPVNDPTTYCTNWHQQFEHGSASSDYGPGSSECQLFMGDRCAKNWDQVCENLYQQTEMLPGLGATCSLGGICSQAGIPLNIGQQLLYSTVAKKYLVEMLNAERIERLFDPTNPTSPKIVYYANKGGRALPVYAVDPETIDSDPVMDRALINWVYMFDIFVNIYYTMKRIGRLSSLRGTKLGKFFTDHPFFASKGGI